MYSYGLPLVAAILVSAGISIPAAAWAGGGNVEAGKQQFTQCGACHAINADAPEKLGPNLAKIVGRRAGTEPSYRSYSDALKRSNIVWSEQTLDAFLKNPMSAIPGTLMPFAGIADDRARADIIAYLSSQAGL